ncbi:hypothetical protein [Methanosarcina barkeri]|uniref:hypothetical protein n=1 Tax=Methanosarcina barkeri TaxID=2208 RepID=UPI000AC795A7|nr:hypothetical protein [Methanosarcina barkeri]
MVLDDGKLTFQQLFQDQTLLPHSRGVRIPYPDFFASPASQIFTTERTRSLSRGWS